MQKITALALSGSSRLPALAAAIGFAAALVSCGGGSGSAEQTSGEPTINHGRIQGFGSIIVNGVRYKDGSARVSIDNDNASRAELRLGMVVEVDGPVNDNGVSGTASSIIARSFVRGPISGEPANNEITVLGIAITVHSGTVFDNIASFGELKVGDFVEVYGHSDNTGRLRATRVEKKSGDASANEVRLTGIASSAEVTSFRIGDITIQYNAAVASTIPNARVSDGMLVRVSGTLNSDGAGPLDITAKDVREVRSPLSAKEGKRAELEGVITNFRSATDFDINGEPVKVLGTAELEGTPVLGAITEVEGVMDNGILMARRVEVEDSEEQEDVDLRGAISEVDFGSRTFKMRDGTVTVIWDSNTEFDDSLQQGASSLTEGMVIEVDGRVSGNVILAESIETSDPNGEGQVEVSGRIANLNTGDRTFTVRDGAVTVRWSDGTEFDDSSLPAGSASLRNGLLIEAKGELQGNMLVATKIQGKE